MMLCDIHMTPSLRDVSTVHGIWRPVDVVSCTVKEVTFCILRKMAVAKQEVPEVGADRLVY